MSIRMFLMIDGIRPGIFSRSGKAHREVREVIMETILPDFGSVMPDDLPPENYPWCFIISGVGLSRNRYFTGAFKVLPGKQGEKLLVVICSIVSYSWLQKNMCSEYPLTFWAARILNIVRISDIAAGNGKTIRQWFRALRWSYSSWKQFALTPAWRFEHQSKMLLREGSQQDYCISDSDGVEVIPWKNWPGCVQHEPGIWVWRQSRHKKILDSQRIPLRHTKANPPRGSFS